MCHKILNEVNNVFKYFRLNQTIHIGAMKSSANVETQLDDVEVVQKLLRIMVFDLLFIFAFLKCILIVYAANLTTDFLLSKSVAIVTVYTNVCGKAIARVRVTVLLLFSFL